MGALNFDKGWQEDFLEDIPVIDEPAPKPEMRLERVERPMFKVPRNGRDARWFRSEWQAYLFLARRAIGWVRDHYRNEQTNECTLCADAPGRGFRDDDGMVRGCRYHDDRSYRRLVERVAKAIRRNERRRSR